MGGKVGDAPNCIALHLHVGAEHLSNKRFKATKRHN